MAQPRDRQVTANVEETLYDLVQKASHPLSASAYIRKLIIEDLRAKKLLTEQELIRMLG